jgi:hypothetical protein
VDEKWHVPHFEKDALRQRPIDRNLCAGLPGACRCLAFRTALR